MNQKNSNNRLNQHKGKGLEKGDQGKQVGKPETHPGKGNGVGKNRPGRDRKPETSHSLRMHYEQ